MKKKRTLLDAGFLLLLAAFLLTGLAAAFLRPKEINLYENRPANRLQLPRVDSFLDASFQESVEEGLSDQVLMSQTFKKVYNDGSSALLFGMLSGFLDSRPQRYVVLRGIDTFGGYNLVYKTRDLGEISERLEQKADGLNRLMDKHPELDFYAYYIEKDTDINFETGEKAGAYELLLDRVALPEGHMARFEIDDFQTFQECFYRTDHHWNYVGSYRAYGEAASLLGISEPLLEPLEEILLPYDFSGSKAAGAGAREVFREEFRAYRFSYPAMDITINGAPAPDYGQQEACFAGRVESLSYGAFYGNDDGEVVFDTGREGKGNLLVLGESYDNAILKLLASHFHKTFSVDLRYYGDYAGRFSFSDYVRENRIDTVLFIGNMDYYILEEFLPED